MSDKISITFSSPLAPGANHQVLSLLLHAQFAKINNKSIWYFDFAHDFTWEIPVKIIAK
jgi:hypothetical protein